MAPEVKDMPFFIVRVRKSDDGMVEMFGVDQDGFDTSSSAEIAARTRYPDQTYHIINAPSYMRALSLVVPIPEHILEKSEQVDTS